MLKAFTIITLRPNQKIIIRMRHAVCILVQFLPRWRDLLNRARVILDERMEIPFQPLEMHEKIDDWESPTIKILYQLIDEIMLLSDSVRQIIDISRFSLPMLFE